MRNSVLKSRGTPTFLLLRCVCCLDCFRKTPATQILFGCPAGVVCLGCAGKFFFGAGPGARGIACRARDVRASRDCTRDLRGARDCARSLGGAAAHDRRHAASDCDSANRCLWNDARDRAAGARVGIWQRQRSGTSALIRQRKHLRTSIRIRQGEHVRRRSRRGSSCSTEVWSRDCRSCTRGRRCSRAWSGRRTVCRA